MFVDHPTYERQPGRLREFVAFREKGLAVLVEHRGDPSASSNREIRKRVNI